MNAPHAFESHFDYSEQTTLAYLEQAKQILATAYEQNPMVRSVMSTCEANGLILIDQLRMLCANLLNQHDQASQALLNMDEIIKDQKSRLAAQLPPEPRKLIETWRSSADKLHCRCDDGTVWSLEKGFAEAMQWRLVPGMGAVIPQWGIR